LKFEACMKYSENVGYGDLAMHRIQVKWQIWQLLLQLVVKFPHQNVTMDAFLYNLLVSQPLIRTNNESNKKTNKKKTTYLPSLTHTHTKVYNVLVGSRVLSIRSWTFHFMWNHIQLSIYFITNFPMITSMTQSLCETLPT